MLNDNNFTIFEDENIFIAKKPFGMLSCKDKKGIDEDLYSIIREKTGCKNLAIINRLDRSVGGIIVFSKNDKFTTILTENIKNNNFEKRYLAIVCGSAKKEDKLINFLMKNQRKNMSKVVNKNSSNAKKAILFYKKVSQIKIDNQVYSLLDINLETGRHHQIRVQMANVNLPLYNDTKYNKSFKRKIGNGNIGLFCYKIAFTYPITNKYLEFSISFENEEIFKNFVNIKGGLL